MVEKVFTTRTATSSASEEVILPKIWWRAVVHGDQCSRFGMSPGLAVILLFLSSDFDKFNALITAYSELGRGYSS